MGLFFKKIFISRLVLALIVFTYFDAHPDHFISDVTHMTFILKKVSRGRIHNPLLLAKVILKECRKYNLDPLLIVALIYQESSFRSYASSHKSAIGLMQLKQSTAQEIAKKLKWGSFSKKDLLNPIKNVKLGIHYLAKLKKQFLNNKVLFLTAYNNGPARTKSLCNMLSKNELKFIYAKKVLRIYSSLKRNHLPSEFPVSMVVASKD